jgi:hypothetical protein
MRKALVLIILLFGGAQAQNWFLGEWSSSSGVSTISLKNYPNGTYTFDTNDFFKGNYHEEGSWKLTGNTLTQAWTDETGQAQQVDYTLERVSDTFFKQSGGNLNGTVFEFFKVTGGDGLGQAPNIPPLFEPSVEQVAVSQIDLSSLGEAGWLVGE